MEGWIEQLMQTMGYAGIAALMFLENVFPPIPSELIMPLAGFSAGQGQLSFWLAVLAGTIGSVVGQLPLYYLGRIVGHARLRGWVERYGHWVMIGCDDVDRAVGWFDRHGTRAVLLARVVPGIRSWISVPAGMAHMPLLPFVLYSTVGMGVWVILLTFLGQLLGQNYHLLASYLGPLGYAMILLLLLAASGWIWYRKRQQRRQGAEQPPLQQEVTSHG